MSERAIADDDLARMTVFVSGRVQGVGFRWWTRSRALALGLSGFARNTDDGRVEVCAEGGRLQCLRLLDDLTREPADTSRPGQVRLVSDPVWTPPRGMRDFVER